jgi:hypothetical protein
MVCTKHKKGKNISFLREKEGKIFAADNPWPNELGTTG